MPAASPNFAILADHDPLLVKYAAQAERYFADDPNTSLIKLRQFAEVLAQQAAANGGLPDCPGRRRGGCRSLSRCVREEASSGGD